MKQTKINIFGKLEEGVQNQINIISKSPAVVGEHIAIMPDNHVGKGACIGWTQTFTDKIIVSLVGLDIGCGMLKVPMPEEFNGSEEHLKLIQSIIRQHVPYGFKVNNQISERVSEIYFDNLKTPLSDKDLLHIKKSLGSLGGKQICHPM